MKDNATPKALSCQQHGLFLGTLCPACSAGHPAEANLKAQPAPTPPYLKKLPSGKRGDLVRVEGRIVDYQTEPCEVGVAKPPTRVLLEFDSVEQVQHETPEKPGLCALAEDEALIADLEVRGDLPGTYASLMRSASERLSLRSGQLAQVLALRDWANDAEWLRTIADEAELLPDNPDGVGTCEISSASQWLWPETRDNLIDIAEKIDGIRAAIEGAK